MGQLQHIIFSVTSEINVPIKPNGSVFLPTKQNATVSTENAHDPSIPLKFSNP